MDGVIIAAWTAVFVVAVLVAKEALAGWWSAWQAPPAPALAPSIYLDTVLEACAAVGLNREALRPETDLLAAGKLIDVLHVSGRVLGRDVELRTVQDVADWLAEAPPQ